MTVTASASIGEFERAGFAANDAATRAALLAAAMGRLAGVTDQIPVGAWFVPGRVEVVGKHMDYAGGRCLAAAMPRGIAVVAAARLDGRVRVVDARYAEQIEIAPGAPGPPLQGWRNYVAVVARRLAENFPGAALGTDIAIASDLPRAAGVSSSSALIVGLAQALIARASIGERPEWQRAIGHTLDLAGYFGAIENGRPFGALGGTDGVGTEGGSGDPAAILASRPGAVTGFAHLPARVVDVAPMPPGWHFVVMTSGVHAGKAGDVRDRFNRTSRLAAALLSLWNHETNLHEPSLAAVLASHPDAAAMLRSLAAGGDAEFTGAELVRRLAHFVGEQARTSDAAAAFRSADSSWMHEIALASQRSAESDLDNQVPETSALARTALLAGAFAATSFGAGFGGSVWALVDGGEPEAARVAAEWARRYRDHVPGLAGAEWFVARPGPPCTAVRW